MHPHDAARMLHSRSERGDRERRRVRREDALRSHHVLDALEELALGSEILDDGLDDELRDADVGQRHHGRDPRDGGIRRGALQPAFRDELVERFGDALLRRVAGAEARVVQLDAMPVERGDLRDAGAHRAGADDGDGRVSGQRGSHRAGEARRALGDERGDAFAIVVTIAQRALQVALEVELRRQRVAGGRLERLLDGRQPARGRLREAREQLVGDGRQLRVVDALPDQSPLRRLLRRELVAEQRESRARARCRPDAAGSTCPPESGMRPILQNAWMKLADFAAMHEIAGEREIGAGARGDAVDRADDRQRQRAQPEHERLVVALDRRAEVHRLAAGRDGAIAEILPGAEAAARAGQQQHADRRDRP